VGYMRRVGKVEILFHYRKLKPNTASLTDIRTMQRSYMVILIQLW
jgi:hypothetical protein